MIRLNQIKISPLLIGTALLVLAYYARHHFTSSHSVEPFDVLSSDGVPELPRLLNLPKETDSETIFGLSMESSRLTEAIRQELIFPSGLPYNLTRPRRKFFSQFGEDDLLSRVFRYKRGGYFVEVGALDGERLSNTLYFERELGWKGLLIEPTPEAFNKLLARNRKSVALNACLSSNTTAVELPFRIMTGAEKNGLKVPKNKLNETSIITVPCYPFYSILQAVGNPVIDFFSLDIEGTELEVLKTIPWEKVNIRLICVEYLFITEGRKGLQTFLEGKGYTLYTWKNIDGFFYRADLFDVPPEKV